MRLERSTLFAHDKALAALQGLRVRTLGEAATCGPEGLADSTQDQACHLQALSLQLDLTQRQLVCALGALVALLRKVGEAGAACGGASRSRRTCPGPGDNLLLAHASEAASEHLAACHGSCRSWGQRS